MFENEMKVTLPCISVQRKDGTIAHYRNSEYIPFFYMIPKEVVEYFGKSFLDIPREPYALFNYKDIKAKIEFENKSSVPVKAHCFIFVQLEKLSRKLQFFFIRKIFIKFFCFFSREKIYLRWSVFSRYTA